METEYSLQDVARCHLCETPAPPLHCDVCDVHLCKDCEGKHLSDESREHTVVQFRHRRSNSKCRKHSIEICNFYCERCNIPICELCVSCREHRDHDVVCLLKKIVFMKHTLQINLQELERYIYPIYQAIESSILTQKVDLEENSKRIKTDIKKHKEALQREIDIIVKKLNADVDEMQNKQMAFLKNQEAEVKHTISEITQCIADLKKVLNSNDVSVVSAYKSRNDVFRRLPSKLNITYPKYTPDMINKETLHEQFIWLSAFCVNYEECDYAKVDPSAESSSADNRPIANKPLIVSDINAEYGLRSVSCLNHENLWTCCSDDIMRLYNLKGELVKSVHTKSRNAPYDIAVTKSGDLVYTDNTDKTVNLVKNTKIQTVIKLHGSSPHGICIASSGDFLIVINSDTDKQTNVVRFSGPTKKQNFKYSDEGQPLYSPGGNNKFICENRNGDICVSDFEAHSLVVINKEGKLRFTYTGHPHIAWGSLNPVGIAADRHGQVLTADIISHYIHILDQDGQFLHYIDNCHLYAPIGLCVDTRDTLFVAEYYRGKVKGIQY